MKPYLKCCTACTLFFIVYFAAVSVSCGLPVYNALEPPINAAQPTNDPLNRVFSFTTADYDNSTKDIYKGTNIYYKLYNNSASRDADISSISTANVEYSDNGIRRLQNLGYSELRPSTSFSSQNDTLIELASRNRKIQVRLFTEGFSGTPYSAGFRIDGVPVNGVFPVRAVFTNSFDFFGSGPLPESSDSDVKYTANAGTDTWYVNAYAVSVGRNTSFTYFYSSLLHLGYITIEK